MATPDIAAGDDEGWRLLPLVERLSHKAWRARQSAFEELAREFAKADGPEAIVFREHIDAMRCAPSESNAAALDAALGALVEYVRGAPTDLCARAVRPGALPVLIERGLGAMRAGTKTRAQDVLYEFAAATADGADAVANELCAFLGHKQAKLAAAAAGALVAQARAFGVTNASSARVYVKAVAPIFAHADKAVRAEGIALVAELSRWLGSQTVGTLCFEGLKPIQVKELQEHLARMPAGAVPRPERYRRGCEPADLPTAMEIDACGGASIDMAEEAEKPSSQAPVSVGTRGVVVQAVDVWELAEAVDVTRRLPAGLEDALASAKWKDRKDALDAVLAAVRTPRIDDGPSGALSMLINLLLARIASDANVLVVSTAAQCVEALASGLRRSFAPLRADALGVILERCKEKNRGVVDALRSALDAVAHSVVAVGDVLPPVDTAHGAVPFAGHKNPQVRAESLGFLARVVPRILRANSTKRDARVIVDAATPGLDDGVADVRDAAASVLAAVLRAHPAASPLLDSLDKMKLAKVHARLEQLSSAPAPSVGGTAPGPSVALGVCAAPSSAAAHSAKGVQTTASVQSATGVSNTGAKPRVGATLGTSTSEKVRAITLGTVAYGHSVDSAMRAAEDLIGADCVAGLGDAAWKTRLASAETLCARLLPGAASSGLDAEAVVRVLAARPGWREINVSVAARMVACVSASVRAPDIVPHVAAAAAALVCAPLVDRLADAKLVAPVRDALDALSCAAGVGLVAEALAEPLQTHKSPRVVAEALSWLAEALDAAPARPAVDAERGCALVRHCLAHANAAVRSSAMRLAGGLFRTCGPAVRAALVADQTAVLTASLDAEFARDVSCPASTPANAMDVCDAPSASAESTDTSAPVPPRPALHSAVHQGAAISSTSASVSQEAATGPQVDLLPVLGPDVAALGDAGWKTRKEALDRAASALARVPLGRGTLAATEFSAELRARFGDTNRNLAAQALDLAAALAAALGTSFERQQHQRLLLGPACASLADIKPQVRAAALRVLCAAYVANGSSVATMAGTIAAVVAGSESPHLRREACAWLSAEGRVSTTLSRASDDDRAALVSAALLCMQDRGADVRRAGTLLAEACVAALGRDAVLRMCVGPERAPLLPMIRQMAPSASAAQGPSSASVVQKSERSATSSQAQAGPAVAQRSERSAGGSQPSAAAQAALPPGGPRTPRKDADASTALALGGPVLRLGEANARSARLEADTRGPRWAALAEGRPPADVVEHLRVQMLAGGQHASPVAPHAARLLLSEDPREAALALAHLHATLSADSASAIVANADILLKIVALRLCDSGATVVARALDVLDVTLSALDAANARLADSEAALFLPVFVARAGELRDPARTRTRAAFRPLCRLYPASRVFAFLADGLRARSARARIYALAEMHVLVARSGVPVVQPARHVPQIAALVADRDAHVRNAALDVLVQLDALLHDATSNSQGVLRFVPTDGSITQRDVDAIGERVRRARETGAVPRGPSALPVDDLDRKHAHPGADDALDSPGLDSPRRPPPTKRVAVGDSPLSMGPAPRVFALDAAIADASIARTSLPADMCDVPAACAVLDRHALAPPGESPFGSVPGANDALDRVLAALRTAPDLECISALQRLDEHLSAASAGASSARTRLPAVVDALALRLYDCTHGALSQSYDQATYDSEAVSQKSRVCRLVVSALVIIANDRPCLTAAGTDALASMLRETLRALVSEHVRAVLDDRDQLERALNVLLVRTLENGSAGDVFAALLGLLEAALRVPPPAEAARLPEFVMKCLWKMTKQIGPLLAPRLADAQPRSPCASPRAQSQLSLGVQAALDAQRLLADAEAFFRALPPMEWKLRASQNMPLGDLPLRTVKTILHELCVALRERAIPAVLALPNAHDGFVLPYVRTMLQAAGVDVSALQRLPSASAPSAPLAAEYVDHAENRQLSPEELESCLKDISGRICSRPDTRAGLLELRAFEAAHGSYAADAIDAHLQRLGSFFYKYIRRNLAQLEPQAAPAGTASLYKSRLEDIQRQIAGVHPESQPRSALQAASPARISTADALDASVSQLSALHVSPMRTLSAAEPATPGRDAAILSLKERLARLRQAE